MNSPAKPIAQPMVILFGLSPIGKPRAGSFKGTDVPAARKAAGKLGLSIIDLTDQPGRTLAGKIPAGRIAAHGDKIVGFIGKDLYAEIEALAHPQAKSGNGKGAGRDKPSPASARLPLNWDDIKVGDRVLAQDTDPADGWWQATVIEQGGDVFKLRWPRTERGRPFQKHRLALGLICPGDAAPPPQPEPKKSSPDSGSLFPRHWSAIGLDQIVLAKEDGPAEQWWEVKTIKMDKDQFTLQWRDHPSLPPIVRPRFALGLVHPSPKAR